MRAIFAGGVAAVVLLALTHRFWLTLLAVFLVVADPLREADAIVPLAGERARVVEAARLFRDGYARWFVITDMHVEDPNPRITYTDSVIAQAEEEGLPRAAMVVAPGTATSTYEEALNLRRLAQARSLRSLIVVTSPYHTRRTRMIMQEVFRDTETEVVVHPVAGHWYRAEDWWTSREGREATVSEYVKMALYVLGYHEMVSRWPGWGPSPN